MRRGGPAAALTTSAACRDADRIAAFLETHQNRVALLPPGLVEPATKVLSIAGDGPFGLFGPDLFGDRPARALDYPVIGAPAGDGAAALDPAWFAYDPSQVWTMTSIGSLCSSPIVAEQAVILGKGWGWAFNGGTRASPAGAGRPARWSPYFPISTAETGNDGATPAILKRSDLAIADHECPIEPTRSWGANYSGSLVFSVPGGSRGPVEAQARPGCGCTWRPHERPRRPGSSPRCASWTSTHPRTGLGMNLHQALAPAFLEVAGLKVALVAFNDVNAWRVPTR